MSDTKLTAVKAALVCDDGPPHQHPESDDALVWREPPQPGEEGILADVEALIAAGHAHWVEDARTPYPNDRKERE